MTQVRIIRFLFSAFMLVVAAATNAQTADQRMGEYLNNGDWFVLEREYPALKDSVQTPMLKHMSEALLGYYFNRPAEALEGVDSLLRHHQKELGLGNITSMLLLKSSVESQRGNYAVAADMVKNFADQLRAQGVNMDYTSIDMAVKMHNCLRAVKPMTVERAAADAVIPMKNENIVLKIKNDTVSRGTMMYVPVTVGGKELQAIFDTGASSTFMSAAFAKKAGVRVISDSLPIRGARLVYGQLGVIDSMQIGGITVRNIPVTINTDSTLNQISDIDFLIGANVMTLLGEIQIFPHAGKIVVPAKPTPKPATGSNMYMDNRMLVIEGKKGDRSYCFMFDTGNGTAALSYNYYKDNKAEIDAKSRRVRRLTGGVGAVKEHHMLVLPACTLSFAGKDVEFTDIAVQLENSHLTPHGGNIGMALVNRFNKVVINFNDCFVSFE